MKPVLLAITGPLCGRTFSIPEKGLSIGRDDGNEVCLDDMRASRRHCRLDWKSGRFTLIDLDSSNGTFVNGVPVKERRLDGGRGDGRAAP